MTSDSPERPVFLAHFARFTNAEIETILDRPSQSRGDSGRMATAHDLLELMVYDELSKPRPVTPSLSIMRQAARTALWFALMDVATACKLQPSELHKDEIEATTLEEVCGVDLVGVFRFLAWDRTGKIELVSALPAVGGPSDVCTGGYLDLQALGRRIAHQAGRPLVTLRRATGI